MSGALRSAEAKEVERRREETPRREKRRAEPPPVKGVAEQTQRERQLPTVKLPLERAALPAGAPLLAPALKLARLKLEAPRALPASVGRTEAIVPCLALPERLRLPAPVLPAPELRPAGVTEKLLWARYLRLASPSLSPAGRVGQAHAAVPPPLKPSYLAPAKLEVVPARAPSAKEAVPALGLSPAHRVLRAEILEPASTLRVDALAPKLALPRERLPAAPVEEPPRMSALAAQAPSLRSRQLPPPKPLALPAPSVSSSAASPRLGARGMHAQPAKIPLEAASVAIQRAEAGAPALTLRAAAAGKTREETEKLAGSTASTASLETEAKETLEVEDTALPPFIRALSEVADSSGRPVVLVVPSVRGDSFVSAVAIACREIYRVVKGGKPEPRWISAASMKEEIERYLSAGDRIFVIDDREGKLLGAGRVQTIESVEARVDLQALLDRLRELFSQDFGFVILHVKEEVADSVYAALEGLHLGVKVVRVEPPCGWSLEDKRRFVEACWGFVEVEGQSFDKMFREAEEKFFEELNNVGKDDAIALRVKQDENASSEHECLKVFVVKCLAKELGCRSRREIAEALRSGLVETEYEFGGGRADIYVPSQQRFVEVETFYGTEDPVKKKLHGVTLSKYINRANRVDVVILNGLLAVLYAHRLLTLAEVYREDHRITVNFYVPNFKEERLVPLKEILDLLKVA
ncbi:MAG: hypothetical protein LM576_00745 [Thermofilum sp.]|nr:hypothetical protein [Thermofilum sp.]